MDSRAYLRENRESQRANSLARRMGGQLIDRIKIDLQEGVAMYA